MPGPLIALIASMALGWADIAVTPSRSGAINAPWQASLSRLNGPSARTEDTLKRYDLDRRFNRDPENSLLVLENYTRRAPDPELVFALAELSWLEGRRLDRKRKPEALNHYVNAVAYSYDYLFDPELAPGRQPGDPRFRLAMDLYNGSLDQVIRASKASGGKIAPGGTIKLQSEGREYALNISLEQSPWSPTDIQEVLLCSDFEVTGADLSTSSYQYGLGVPLIGVRKKPEESVNSANPMEKYYPPEMAFPITAFMRPNSRLRDPALDVKDVRACTIYLVDPVELRSVVQEGAAFPIESDLTTPLAYMWSRTDLSNYKWRGFLRPGSVMEGKGLMLLRPYQPDKIPVVMVHGLMSSPLSWIPMLNELLRDPNIQRRYQFMLYVYPTGVSVPIAASYLREAMLDARQQFDPQGTSSSFNQTVILGHSMGGLLSHAMAVDSEDHFWNLNSYRDFDDLIGPREVLDEVRRYTFFEAVPFVSRVVFMATPHRGSDYAGGAIGRIGSSLISQPDHYSDLLSQLVQKNPDAFNSRRFKRFPTSIENLEIDSPILLALMQMKPRPGVQFHSIIGAKYPDARSNTTDGVVSYTSSHFSGSISEKVVNSDHSLQKAPLAILEVKRILLEHLNSPDNAAVAASPPASLAAPGPAQAAAVPALVQPASAYDPVLTRPLPPPEIPAGYNPN